MNQMKKTILLAILSFWGFQTVRAQHSDSAKIGQFTMDALMGTYLLLDDVMYKSVTMRGTRIGYQTHNNWGFNVEYIIGNQRDTSGLLGTTHSATGMVQYFLTDQYTKFRPYGYAGGGFFEFKDFSRDQYGIAYYMGAGTELKIFDKVRGYVECRYLNIGQLELGGTNQIGVFWGIKGLF